MKNGPGSPEKIPANRLAEFILDAGVFLMSSGAHSGRVWRNCERMAARWNYHINISPTFTGILLSVWDKNNPDNAVTRYKASPPSSVHLEVLTRISHLSWKIAYGEISFNESVNELAEIRKKKHYSHWVIAGAVGFACGLLCILAGGDAPNAAVAFTAASTGYIIRFQILLKGFNNFLSLIVAAFVTSLIAGADTVLGLGKAPEMTLSTAVLYLVPGVPLVNSVIDLLEGYFPASLSRSLFAASVLLCIAVGMTLSILLLGISNF
ncbi:MAG: threonine/serine exporter family protein [Bacteroidales bacterium]|nr:threonine/serine exporter family protein [Bacteroidales bacterium]